MMFFTGSAKYLNRSKEYNGIFKWNKSLLIQIYLSKLLELDQAILLSLDRFSLVIAFHKVRFIGNDSINFERIHYIIVVINLLESEGEIDLRFVSISYNLFGDL